MSKFKCDPCLRGFIMFVMLSVSIFSDSYAASVGSESPPAANKSEKPSQDNQLKQNYSTTTIPLQIILDTVTTTEKASLSTQRKDQPLKIGFSRDLPQLYSENLYPWLSWNDLPGNNRVAAFSITSPDASAIRVGIQIEQLPQDAEIRFFSTENSETFGPFIVKNIRSQQDQGNLSKTEPTDSLFWSPVIEGDTAGVEIYLPSPVRGSFIIKVPKIQHLVYSARYSKDKDLSHIGNSGSCNIDVECRTTIPDGLSAAVAKIIFSDNIGSYLCTGTLLNDKDTSTFIPYFMTANHCLSTQSVANTIDSYWFFERATCGGPDPTSVTHFTNGADLLATNSSSDFTFLRLRDTQISNLPGILFSGWTTANPTGLTAIGLHHPRGDLKKWSQGTANGFASYLGSVSGVGTHIQVTWSEGVTEGGSSGSGLFSVINGQHLFIGNLHGGYSSCSNQTAPDWYGRFDITYPAVSQWLAYNPLGGDGRDVIAGLTSTGKVFYTTNLATWINLPGTLNKLAAGDGDGDGNTDLAGLTSAGQVFYTTNRASWTHVPGALSALVVGNFNGDAYDDLAGLTATGKIFYTTNRASWVNVPGTLATLTGH